MAEYATTKVPRWHRATARNWLRTPSHNHVRTYKPNGWATATAATTTTSTKKTGDMKHVRAAHASTRTGLLHVDIRARVRTRIGIKWKIWMNPARLCGAIFVVWLLLCCCCCSQLSESSARPAGFGDGTACRSGRTCAPADTAGCCEVVYSLVPSESVGIPNGILHK